MHETCAHVPFIYAPDYHPRVLHGSGNWWRDGQRPRIDSAVYRLLTIVSGGISCRLRDGTQRAGAGDTLLIPPHELLDVRSRGQHQVYAVGFIVGPAVLSHSRDSRAWVADENGPLQPGPVELWGTKAPTLMPDSLRESMRQNVMSIVDSWWRSDLHRLAAHHTLAGMLLDLARWCGQQDEPRAGRPVSDQLLHFIDQNLPTITGVADLASHAGVSVAPFSRWFSAHYGESPGSFLRRKRIELAEQRLTHSDQSVGGVALWCGFASASAFQQTWRLYHDISPGRWRREARGRVPLR